MRVTTRHISQMKRRSERIAMVTAYDALSAGAAERTGIPMVLVGDSLGQVVLGYDSTVPVSMEDMVSHTAAVARCAPSPLIVADLPFLSYQASEELALTNAARLLQEGGAQAVKLEGGVSVAPHGEAADRFRNRRNGPCGVYSAIGQPAGWLPGTGPYQKRSRSDT